MSRASRRVTIPATFLIIAASLGAIAGEPGTALGSKASSGEPTVTLLRGQRYWNPIAISAYGKYVWVLDDNGGAARRGEIFRIDAATGARTQISSPLLNVPTAIYAQGPDVWIANELPEGEAHTLLKLVIATGRMTKVDSRAVSHPIGVAARGRYLWLLNSLDGSTVSTLNTATGAVNWNGSLETSGGLAITSDRAFVWVGGARLLRFSSSLLHPRVIAPALLSDVRAVASDGVHLWALESNRHLYEVDVSSDRISGFFNPQFEFANNVATNGHYVWLADYQDDSVWQLNVATRRFTQIRLTIPAVSSAQLSPWVVASDGSSAWVTIICNRTVNHVRVECGEVAKITP